LVCNVRGGYLHVSKLVSYHVRLFLLVLLMLLRRYVYITLLLKLLVVLLLYLFKQHIGHWVIAVILRLRILNLRGNMIAVDLGHCHFIKLWVLRLFNGLKGLHYTFKMLCSIKVQSTPSSVSLYRLKLGINQIVAVKSAIFWTRGLGVQPSVCISIFTIGIITCFFSFGLASLHIIFIWRWRRYSFITLLGNNIGALIMIQSTGYLFWTVYLVLSRIWSLILGNSWGCWRILSNVALIASLIGAALRLSSLFLC